MAIADRNLEQLAADTVLHGGRPVASIGMAWDELGSRDQFAWFEGEDELGPFCATALQVNDENYIVVAYSEVPEPSLLVIGEQGITHEGFRKLLGALRIPDSRVIDFELPPPATESERRTLTKAAFVAQVAEQSGLTKSEAAAAVDAVLKTIETTLKRGDEVSFAGFGKFHVASRGRREGRNPRTGETMNIAAAKVPRFTAGSRLKRVIL